MHHYSHSSSPTLFMALTPLPIPTLTQMPCEDGYINLFCYPPACWSSVTIHPDHTPNTSIPSSSTMLTNNGHQSVVAVVTPHIITPVADQGSRNQVSRCCWDMAVKIWQRCVRGFKGCVFWWECQIHMCKILAL